jgi:CHASE2 domain-containing sensor protein
MVSNSISATEQQHTTRRGPSLAAVAITAVAGIAAAGVAMIVAGWALAAVGVAPGALSTTMIAVWSVGWAGAGAWAAEQRITRAARDR